MCSHVVDGVWYQVCVLILWIGCVQVCSHLMDGVWYQVFSIRQMGGLAKCVSSDDSREQETHGSKAVTMLPTLTIWLTDQSCCWLLARFLSSGCLLSVPAPDKLRGVTIPVHQQQLEVPGVAQRPGEGPGQVQHRGLLVSPSSTRLGGPGTQSILWQFEDQRCKQQSPWGNCPGAHRDAVANTKIEPGDDTAPGRT